MNRQIQDAYIVSAVRTPVGKAPRGVFRNTRPDDLLAHVIKASLAAAPGIDPAQIEVSYQDGYVWIHGENKAEEKDKQRKYYRQQAQSFSYRVAIPGDIDPTAEPEATCKHGVMRVAFAKSPVRQPKKIQVKRLD